jgi:hypothetical protein
VRIIDATEKNTIGQAITCRYNHTKKLEKVCRASSSEETRQATEKESHDSKITNTVRKNVL